MKLFDASKVYLFDLEAHPVRLTSDFVFEGEGGLDNFFFLPNLFLGLNALYACLQDISLLCYVVHGLYPFAKSSVIFPTLTV